MSTLKKVPFAMGLFKSSIPYPAPSNLNYFWNFGILAMFFLAIQIVTGLFLAMHYLPSIDLAFLSVEHIMRDVHYGWLFRYLHANGASFFFIVVYLHMFRGIYYASYSIYSSRYFLWAIGVIIFFLMIVIAFLGYVLPWGQMSFWGATVITNLVGAIPVIGNKILILLWGSFFISQPTLDRFFILHFFLPAVLTVLVVVHLALLHEYHSSNPLSLNFSVDSISFFPYYIWKDLLGVFFFFIIYSVFVLFYPNYLSHSINYVEADPLVTPPHIVPEWYFLPFYAILRSIPDKLAGVIFLLLSIFVMLLFPSAEDEVIFTPYFDVTYKIFFWGFIVDWLILTYVGGCPAEEPFITIGWVTTLNYFLSWYLLSGLNDAQEPVPADLGVQGQPAL